MSLLGLLPVSLVADFQPILSWMSDGRASRFANCNCGMTFRIQHDDMTAN